MTKINFTNIQDNHMFTSTHTFKYLPILVHLGTNCDVKHHTRTMALALLCVLPLFTYGDSTEQASDEENLKDIKEKMSTSNENQHIETLVEKLEKLTKESILSNMTRLSIMLVLMVRKSITFSELYKILKISPSTLEEHLSKLAENGFIEKRKTLENGCVRTVIRVTEKGLQRTLEYVRNMVDILRGVTDLYLSR